MTRTTPLRLMTLHLGQIILTEALTFMADTVLYPASRWPASRDAGSSSCCRVLPLSRNEPFSSIYPDYPALKMLDSIPMDRRP